MCFDAFARLVAEFWYFFILGILVQISALVLAAIAIFYFIVFRIESGSFKALFYLMAFYFILPFVELVALKMRNIYFLIATNVALLIALFLHLWLTFYLSNARINKFLIGYLAKAWELEKLKPQYDKRGAMDLYHLIFKCCGFNGPHDYDKIDRLIALTCVGHDLAVHKAGCKDQIEKFLPYGKILITVLIILLGFTIACTVHTVREFLKWQKKQKMLKALEQTQKK